MFGLIDCNNFYASCERLFRPDLDRAPVIVLSNNDGCAVARSNEAKALGIKMGDPEFKIRELVAREHVQVFSSNYALYGDISRRVRETITTLVAEIEPYSIDESFLSLSHLATGDVVPLARELRDRVLHWTGIPTCVGIGPTKTLAKLGNYLAKKRPQFEGVCDLRDYDHRADLLPTVPIEEVWGIGAASARKLKRFGVATASDLAEIDPDQARSLLTVVGGRIVYELRGTSCLTIEMLRPTRKGIAVTRSFGMPVTTWPEMSQAVASYATRAAEKMRRHRVAAGHLYVFLHTSPFRKDPWYSNGASGRFMEATTNDTAEIASMAVRLGERIWRPGYRYAKAGVMLSDLLPDGIQQRSLWSGHETEKRKRLWKVVDDLNKELGADTVRLLSTGNRQASWKMKSGRRSPRATTRWDELPLAKA